jgi:hypothetical protein
MIRARMAVIRGIKIRCRKIFDMIHLNEVIVAGQKSGLTEALSTKKNGASLSRPFDVSLWYAPRPPRSSIATLRGGL